MKVIYDIGKVKKIKEKDVLAIGVFDGVHLGHQAIIKEAIKKARAIRAKVYVLTFSPHPVQVLYPQDDLKLIMPLEQRLKLLSEFEVDVCIVAEFTKQFSKTSAKDFIDSYLKNKLAPSEIIIGSDFRFGYHKQGDVSYLKKEEKGSSFHLMKVTAVLPKGHHKMCKKEKKVSSSTIRSYIMQGKLRSAGALLGRPVSLMGTVVKGDVRGAALGFPTANLKLKGIVVPPLGVYAVEVLIAGKIYKGMANIGRKPTFHKKNNPVNLEVHVFGSKRNLYGKNITVILHKKIRTEKQFSSRQALISQLSKDRKKTLSILL